MKFWLPAVFFALSTASAQQRDTIVLSDKNRTSVTGSVTATAAQLEGKWRIVKIENAKHVEMPQDKVAGSFIDFGPDGHYTAHVIGTDETGQWKLSPQQTAIHLFANGAKTIWNIFKIGGELVIQKGIRGNIVTLTKA